MASDMFFELTEIEREIVLLLLGQRLAADHDDMMVEQRLADLRGEFRRRRLRQVGAENLDPSKATSARQALLRLELAPARCLRS
jgi:hypothetical protein